MTLGDIEKLKIGECILVVRESAARLYIQEGGVRDYTVNFPKPIRIEDAWGTFGILPPMGGEMVSLVFEVKKFTETRIVSDEEKIEGAEEELSMADTINFGKHSGKLLSDSSIPDDYILWLLETRKKELQMYEGELKRRKETAEALTEASMSMTEKLIEEGFKALAKKYHPDKGGDPEKFMELKGSYESMKAVIGEIKKP